MLILDIDSGRREKTEEYLKKHTIEYSFVDTSVKARLELATNNYDLFFCDLTSIGNFPNFENEYPGVNLILFLTEAAEANYSKLVSHSKKTTIISCAGFDPGTFSRAFIVGAKKLRSKEVFGGSLYFSNNVISKNYTILSSSHRHEAKDLMIDELRKIGVRSNVADRMSTVAEELLMNAIYDAPVDTNGEALYNHRSRKDEIELSVDHQPELICFKDEQLAGVAVIDSFGALPSDLIVKYLKTCYEGDAGVLNGNKGGAGRGLHQIIENSDVTVFNVYPGHKTEVLCLFSLEKAGTLPLPTFHYFSSNNGHIAN